MVAAGLLVRGQRTARDGEAGMSRSSFGSLTRSSFGPLAQSSSGLTRFAISLALMASVTVASAQTPPPAPGRFEAFSSFLARTRSATAESYRGQPGARD